MSAAEAAGVSAADAAAFLASNEAEEAVRSAVQRVHRLGFHSIPTLLINGQLALSGAARSDEVLEQLRAAAAMGVAGARRFAVA